MFPLTLFKCIFTSVCSDGWLKLLEKEWSNIRKWENCLYLHFTVLFELRLFVIGVLRIARLGCHTDCTRVSQWHHDTKKVVISNVWRMDRRGSCSILITYIYTYIHTHTPINSYTHTYVHTYIHTHTYTCVHTYICTYIHTYVHTYIHTYVRTYIRTCVHTHIYTCMHTYIHTYYIHTYIYTYIHSFIHIYIHTHTHTHTHTKAIFSLSWAHARTHTQMSGYASRISYDRHVLVLMQK